MEPDELAQHLRVHGVYVHGVHARPPAADGSRELVVFLEQNRGHGELARSVAESLPGVLEVRFPESPALMWVRCAK